MRAVLAIVSALTLLASPLSAAELSGTLKQIKDSGKIRIGYRQSEPPMSFVDASAIPQSGPIAVQGTAGAGPGDRVLINGAGGGSGSLAIQLAKRAGAHVTGVDNATKLEHMRAMGADRVIDYTREDFTKQSMPYDIILDLVASRSVFALRRALAPGGRYRCVGGPVRALLRIATLGALIARSSGRRMGVLAVRGGPGEFAPVAQMVIDGEIELPIDGVFGLADVGAALTRVGMGRSMGKVVVEIAREEQR